MRAASVQNFVKQAKQFSGYRHRQLRGTPLWQPSWHDRALRTGDDAAAAMRYVLENPLRAKLVTRLTEYPFIGSGVVSRKALLASLR